MVVTIYLAIQLLTVAQQWLGAVLAVALYLVFGAVIAFIAGPPVELLHRRLGVPRTVAVLAVLAAGLGIVALLGWLVSGGLVSEARSLADQAPTLVDKANSFIAGIRNQLNSHGISVGSGGLPADTVGAISSHIASFLVAGIGGIAAGLLDILVTLVVAFWLLRDGAGLREGLLGHLPGRMRSEVDFGLEAFGVVIGGYVRAQLLMAALIGLMAGIGCALLGVPFPIVVALAAGIFELVPLVGPFIGGAVGILLAYSREPTLALWTGLLFVGIHIIEAYLVAPRIQARFVRLHPLVVLLALFAGIDAGGFLGALFAVPLASLLAVYIRAALGDVQARRPELFLEKRADSYLERRRRRLLREFRIFGGSS